MNNAYLGLGLAFIGGAALGSGAAYLVLVKKLDAKYDEMLTEENKKTRDFYERRYKAGAFESPIDAAEELGAVEEAADALRRYSPDVYTQEREATPEEMAEYHKKRKPAVEDEIMITERGVESVQDVVEHNIFEENGDSVVLDIARRTPDRPYVITEEEFSVNEPEHDQIQLTYYAGDGVLSDDQDGEVSKVEEIVGEANLIYFGVGSGDPNVLFVRNQKLDSDYEISLRQDKYKVVVLSFDDDDLQHSDEPMRRKKPRWDD